MLERMDQFFEKRLEGYDEHMRTEVECGAGFYLFTAEQLPKAAGAEVLDLGCGTGLELEEYLRVNPGAHITGIDLSEAMLRTLAGKFPDKHLNLVKGSYFEVPFEKGKFNAAVSVESLHHFTREQKLSLYRKLLSALKPGGYFILTDYFAESEALETEYFNNLAKLKEEQNIRDNEFYHYDTPLTVEHEAEVLREAGFAAVSILKNWDTTYTLKAEVYDITAQT